MAGLYLSGQINEIQSDLFTFLNKIRFISINIENTRQFFHLGLRWLQSINRGFNANLIKISNTSMDINLIAKKRVIVSFAEYAHIFGSVYNYPDEDLCLFKDFPHAQLVYPSITLTDTVTCSCTLIWLIRYSKYYMNEDLTHYDQDLYLDYPSGLGNFSVRQCLHKDFDRLLNKCDIDARLELCIKNNLTLKDSSSSLNTNADFAYLFKAFQYVMGVYVKPIFCFLGIVTNLVVFIMVSNKAKKKELKQFNV